MNAKWIKQNLTIVIAVTVYVAIVGLIVWQQQAASHRTDEVVGELQQQQSRLQSLLSGKLFPSQQNLQAARQMHEQVEEQYNALHQAVCVRSLQIPQADRAIDFFGVLAQRIGLMRQHAKAGSVKVPDNFAFGFSRYASVPPSTEDTNTLALLSKQLAAIQKLTDTLIDSHVDEIVTIRRSPVEGEGGDASKDGLNEPIANDSKALYHVLPFEFEFFCKDQGGVQKFLNALLQLDCFFTVRTVRIATEGVETSVSESSRPAKTETGAGKARLSVSCRIDMVEFAEETKPEAKK